MYKGVAAKIQVILRVLIFFVMLKFVFIFYELKVVQSVLSVTALLLIILSVLYILAEEKLSSFVDFILSYQLGFGLLFGYELIGNCEKAYFDIIIFASSYITLAAGFFIFLIKFTDKKNISDLSGFNKKHPWFALFLTLLLWTLAGLPLAAMFASRLNILFILVETKSYLIAVIAVISFVMLIYACARIVVQIFYPAKIHLNSDEKIYTEKTWVLNFAAILVSFILIIVGLLSFVFISF